MNTCGFDAALLDLFLDGALSAEEMKTVQAHLEVCPACQSYVDDMLTMRDFFPDVEEVELPENFAANVMAAVAKAPQSHPRKQPWGKLAVAAACLACIVMLQRFDLPANTDPENAAPQKFSSACVAVPSAPEESVSDPSPGEKDSAETVLDAANGMTTLSPSLNETEKAADPAVCVTATEEDVDGLLDGLTPAEVRPGYACYLLEGDDPIVAELFQRKLLQEMPETDDIVRLEIFSE